MNNGDTHFIYDTVYYTVNDTVNDGVNDGVTDTVNNLAITNQEIGKLGLPYKIIRNL